MEHHVKLRSAVGTRADGLTITLHAENDDERGRLLILTLRSECWFVSFDQTRAIALAVYGKRWVGAHELAHEDCRGMTYVLELEGALHFPVRPLQVSQSPPFGCRWFDARVLSAGIGQQDGGRFVPRRYGRYLAKAEESA